MIELIYVVESCDGEGYRNSIKAFKDKDKAWKLANFRNAVQKAGYEIYRNFKYSTPPRYNIDPLPKNPKPGSELGKRLSSSDPEIKKAAKAEWKIKKEKILNDPERLALLAKREEQIEIYDDKYTKYREEEDARLKETIISSVAEIDIRNELLKMKEDNKFSFYSECEYYVYELEVEC